MPSHSTLHHSYLSSSVQRRGLPAACHQQHCPVRSQRRTRAIRARPRLGCRGTARTFLRRARSSSRNHRPTQLGAYSWANSRLQRTYWATHRFNGDVDVDVFSSPRRARRAGSGQPSMNSDKSQSTSHRMPLVMSAFLCDSYGHSSLLVGAVPPNLPRALSCRIAPRTTAMIT